MRGKRLISAAALGLALTTGAGTPAQAAGAQVDVNAKYLTQRLTFTDAGQQQTVHCPDGLKASQQGYTAPKYTYVDHATSPDGTSIIYTAKNSGASAMTAYVLCTPDGFTPPRATYSPDSTTGQLTSVGDQIRGDCGEAKRALWGQPVLGHSDLREGQSVQVSLKPSADGRYWIAEVEQISGGPLPFGFSYICGDC